VSVQSVSAVGHPGGKRSEVWRGSSGRCELRLRPSGACQTEAQGVKAKEGREELQGRGTSMLQTRLP
jgi:hypothetical protein